MLEAKTTVSSLIIIASFVSCYIDIAVCLAYVTALLRTDAKVFQLKDGDVIM